MLNCPLCRQEWVFTSKLCESCDKIRHLMTIYDRDIILDILDKCLVVQKFIEHNDYKKDEKTGKWIKKKEEEKQIEKKI